LASRVVRRRELDSSVYNEEVSCLGRPWIKPQVNSESLLWATLFLDVPLSVHITSDELELRTNLIAYWTDPAHRYYHGIRAQKMSVN
jgi:hypothetical protein